MFRPLEAFIGLRYVRAKRRNHFISFISLISMLGIAVGVWALITVLSVMNGFEKEVRERILSMASHATIEAMSGPLRDWRKVARTAREDAHVLGAAPYVRGQAMLSSGGQNKGVLVRGIEPAQEPSVSQVGENMIAGSLNALQPRGYGIVLGAELAAELRVFPGDRVTVIIPQATVSPAGILPRFKRFTVVGVFEVGMHEYDSALAVMHLDDAARLYRLDDAVSGVRLRLDDLFQAPRLARQIVRSLPGGYLVDDWTRQHANLFRAISMEKRVMFIILFLIVAVAAFNIVSTLVMVVTDKEADIAILRTLGAAPGTIMGVFMIQGSVIGVIGTLLGVATGIPTALNVEAIVSTLEHILGMRFLSPDVYYITQLTGDMHWSDVGLIGGFSLAISLLATLYPAWRGSRTQPAEAL
ncbi:MAG: lipoprotein-releasing ABC transporter permease subunit, partial [Gammaproteobacteria bacterium]|nr:lipoprotein-releasing ABC transporter permease subunit [Gammaproteobacteria bacterium]NIR98487.1 lipoprotein-releasing ABC transporter permease subunit [Gammaproteobacteria bacterium]NIT64231.1 lipoprotein-releasing ABC transporter permease subunit [Gammaproteobacteria bacterium]NIV21175.1 lipoprotein-releasing ABC transporter permease subunit [Gammaproteobacteria bacterium]NIX10096.1 lipoprotein-releasing ABC transporter permease subunit [Gammaproteobacteria bacterium]